MWIDNTRNAKIKGDQIEVFKILEGARASTGLCVDVSSGEMI